MDKSPPLTSSYATLFMRNRDKLCFLQFPEPLFAASIEPILRAAWPAGIQAQKPVPGGREYQLHGKPFGTFGDKDGVAARALVRNLLAFLYERGWVLVLASCTSRTVGSKDTLVFRQRRQVGGGREAGCLLPDTSSEVSVSVPVPVPALLPPPVDWLVVAFCGVDKLRVVGGGDQVGLFPAIKAVVEAAGLFQAAEFRLDGAFEVKMKGWPWNCHREKRVRSEALVLRLVEVLDSFGWRAYVSLRMRTETDKAKKQDTWFLVKSQDWVKGSPFNAETVEPMSLMD